MADLPAGESPGRAPRSAPHDLPPAAAAALARTWEHLLAERYPGTQWTLTIASHAGHRAEPKRDEGRGHGRAGPGPALPPVTSESA